MGKLNGRDVRSSRTRGYGNAHRDGRSGYGSLDFVLDRRHRRRSRRSRVHCAIESNRGYTLLEAVVVIAVTSSIVGIATGAVLSFARIGRVITDTSTTVVGLAMLEKTLVDAAANIAAPPGLTVQFERRSTDRSRPGVERIEVPYYGGDPCSVVVVESIGDVTRVLHREGSHEKTIITAPVSVEFVFHENDRNLVTLRARDLPRAAITVRLGNPARGPVGEARRDRPNTEAR